MKIRKGLLAAATAATVSIAGMSAPAFAEEKEASSNVSLGSSSNKAEKGKGNGETADGEEEEKQSFGEFIKENSSDKDGNWDPKQITAWIAVFTAIIGALGTVITFIDKNFK